jgi:hypothetical protein
MLLIYLAATFMMLMAAEAVALLAAVAFDLPVGSGIIALLMKTLFWLWALIVLLALLTPKQFRDRLPRR